MHPIEDLTTFAPAVTDTAAYYPTGNLLISLPEIDEAGVSHSLTVVSAAHRGLIEARGRLLVPSIWIDGQPAEFGDLEWARVASWIPEATGAVSGGADRRGAVRLHYVPSIGERGESATGSAGIVVRLAYTNQSDTTQDVSLAWRGHWSGTNVRYFRPRPLDVSLRAHEDTWTGSRVVTANGTGPVLAVAWRAGHDATLGPDDGELDEAASWAARRSGRVDAGDSLTVDVYLGVATEPDGAAATALHLRRLGFDRVFRDATTWLRSCTLPADSAVPSGVTTSPETLFERVNTNLFFNFFYAQADTLDGNVPVALTSRSPRYYVCGALWSRDAFAWSFPALLLVDPHRARHLFLATLRHAGEDIAQHALYLTGGVLYPGFELDELTAPVIALFRYLQATGDRQILAEPETVRLRELVRRELGTWQGPQGLYGTFLLPTDDPTDHPYTATNNATVAVVFELLAEWDGDDPELADALRNRLTRQLRIGDRWAWAIDEDGNAEWREEPPLSLRTLPYWGAATSSDMAATTTWLTDEYRHAYPGRFGGLGAPHFPAPSGFDLAWRILSGDTAAIDQFAAAPLDADIACESWDADSGEVRSGGGMASMAGLLAWTTWAALTGHRHWRDPLPRPDNTEVTPPSRKAS